MPSSAPPGPSSARPATPGVDAGRGHCKLEVSDVEVARPGPHEVLVQTAAAGLCHSDLHVIDGSLTIPTPVVLGHESAGVVAAVGAERLYIFG